LFYRSSREESQEERKKTGERRIEVRRGKRFDLQRRGKG
jgi:hypothetical protein